MSSRAIRTAQAYSPVIVLEMNELCPPILDRMMQRGELPNFKQLRARSDVYITHTTDTDLEPWVQWVTLHTGQKQEVHGVKELDEGYRIELPRIWDRLADWGVSCLVFGSMNARAASDRVFLMPDAWSKRVQPSDTAYNAFQDFISFHITEHTNREAKPSPKVVLNFLFFILLHGFSLRTVFMGVRQILHEKLGSRDVKWRRAIVLDWLIWNIFVYCYKRQKPLFATFFTNSTAFLQHRYWRHMSPELYAVKPSTKEMVDYGDAIESSYRNMDKILGRAAKLVGKKGGRLVLATALSQEANLRYESIGGKFVYRAHNFERLNAWAGGPVNITFEPVMTHQAWASLASEGDAVAFETMLVGLQSDGTSIMEWRRSGDRVMFWCRFISLVPKDLEITNAKGEKISFSELFALVGQVNNSQHNRNGAFWVQRHDNCGRVHDEKLPLEQVSDKILALYSYAISYRLLKQMQH